jgi:hypothetical protein
MSEFRHHRAVQIVFVETPSAGSPVPIRQADLSSAPRSSAAVAARNAPSLQS